MACRMATLYDEQMLVPHPHTGWRTAFYLLSANILSTPHTLITVAFNLGSYDEVPFVWNKPEFPYVYWTVRHLDSWITRDQLDVTCFVVSLFNAQHVSDVLTSETCWALNNEIIKQVTSSWSLFIQLPIFLILHRISRNYRSPYLCNSQFKKTYASNSLWNRCSVVQDGTKQEILTSCFIF